MSRKLASLANLARCMERSAVAAPSGRHHSTAAPRHRKGVRIKQSHVEQTTAWPPELDASHIFGDIARKRDCAPPPHSRELDKDATSSSAASETQTFVSALELLRSGTRDVDRKLLFTGPMEALCRANRDLRGEAQKLLHSFGHLWLQDPAHLYVRQWPVEELCMELLSHWLEAIAKTLARRELAPEVAMRIICATDKIYDSVLPAKVPPHTSELDQLEYTLYLRSVQQAAISRLYSVAYCAGFFDRHTPEVRARALMLAVKAVRDPRLRGALARNACRRVIFRIQRRLQQSDGIPHDVTAICEEMGATVANMLQREVLSSPLGIRDGPDGYEDPNTVAKYFALTSGAIVRARASLSIITSDLLPLAIMCVAGDFRKSGKHGNEGVLRDARLDWLDLSPLPLRRTSQHGQAGVHASFVGSADQLDRVVRRIVDSRSCWTALDLYVLAPPAQRSFMAACALMCFFSAARLLWRDDRLEKTRSNKHEVSRALLRDATAQIAWDGDARSLKAQLRLLVCSRFVAHCHMLRYDQIVDDLDRLCEVWPTGDGRRLDRSELLLQLGERGQRLMLATLARLGRWQETLESSAMIIKVSYNVEQRSKKEGEDEPNGYSSTRPVDVQSTLGSRLLQSLVRVMLEQEWPSKHDEMAQVMRTMTFIRRFCEVTGATPDRKLHPYLLQHLEHAPRHIVHPAMLDYLADQVDWSWHRRGVHAVVADVRTILRGDGLSWDTGSGEVNPR